VILFPVRPMVEFEESFWARDEGGRRHKINVYRPACTGAESAAAPRPSLRSHKLAGDGALLRLNADGTLTCAIHRWTMKRIVPRKRAAWAPPEERAKLSLLASER